MTDWLFDTLLWTAALMLLVLAVRAPVAERFGARVAYALWLLPVARLLMPTLTTTVERESVFAAADLGPAAVAPMPSVDPEIAPVVSVVNDTAGGAATTFVGAATEWLEIVDVSFLLLSIWTLGAASTFAWHQLRYLRDRRAVLSSSMSRGRVGGIDLIVSPNAPGPMALGTIRRVIALPQSYLDACSETELDLALEHELSHHRSGDLWARQAGLLLLSLHWFNPIAWKAYAAFHFDQEAACDARVIARRGREVRADYGRAIARSAAPQRILTANARDTDLKRRLTMMKNVSHRPLGLLVIAAVALVIVPATASRAVEYVEDAPPAPPEAPTAPTASLAPQAPAAPEAPSAAALASLSLTQDRDEDRSQDTRVHHDRVVHMDGSKAYSEMTPAERREFDAAIRELRSELAELRAERPELEREIRVEMREARDEAMRDRVEARDDMAEAQREIDQAMAEVRRDAAKLRADGKDPEIILASLGAAKAALGTTDFDGIIEASLASVDETVVLSSLEAAEAGMAAALREMEAQRKR